VVWLWDNKAGVVHGKNSIASSSTVRKCSGLSAFALVRQFFHFCCNKVIYLLGLYLDAFRVEA
jgi:hypothetical protein